MKVGVIGLGYVGLPLAVAFSEEGHEVVGLDVDARRVAALGQGRSHVVDIPGETLASSREHDGVTRGISAADLVRL